MAQTVPSRSTKQLESDALELVRNGIILHPEEPARTLAAQLYFRDDTDTMNLIGQVLCLRYLTRAIKAERLKARPTAESLPLFPGLENLPRRIVTQDGKRPLLAQSTVTQIRWYVKGLHKRHRERIADLKALLTRMSKYSRKERGLTAAMVAHREA